MAFSPETREKIIRFYVILNSPPVVLGSIFIALAAGIAASVFQWYITALFCYVSAAFDFGRMLWLKKHGHWWR